MKITLEIPDALFHAAGKAAGERRTTLRALVEEGLRRVLADGGLAKSWRSFRFQTFGGDGLTEEAAGGSWDANSRIVYEGRGE